MNAETKQSSEKQNPEMPTYVLLEDDEIFRMVWKLEAKVRGRSVQIYSDVNTFFDSEAEFPPNAVFLLDNDLGEDRDAGKRVARRLRELRSGALIFMQTSHPPEHFEKEVRERIVDGVLGKDPDLEMIQQRIQKQKEGQNE